MSDWYEEMERAEQEYDATQYELSRSYDEGYQQGRAEAYIECMKIVSECVWKDSEMLEKMLEEQFKEYTDE